MTKWHQTRIANIGLRAVGLGLLYAAWVITVTLYHRVHLHAPREASLGELGLCALLVASALTANALLFVGPGLWKQVQVPGRRSFSMPELQSRDHTAGRRDNRPQQERDGIRGATTTAANVDSQDRNDRQRLRFG